MKRCGHCKIEKPADDFAKCKRTKGGLYSWCKRCVNESYAANAAKRRAQQAEYRARNRDARLEAKRRDWFRNHESNLRRCREWREKNRERQALLARNWYASNRELTIGRAARWAGENRDQHRITKRAVEARRRAQKLQTGGSHGADDIRKAGEGQKWRCWWCGDNCKKSYHVDHRIPLARGGDNSARNIVVACPTCNLRKHTKLPAEFVGRLL